MTALIDTEYEKGIREDGVFDVNKYVVQTMTKMVSETSSSPSQLVTMLTKRAETLRNEYVQSRKRKQPDL